MNPKDFDEAIRCHGKWRRQFLNAFAGGNYADMPLSEHRSCLMANQLAVLAHPALPAPVLDTLQQTHERFHSLANEILELSQSGLGDAADLLLPEFNETAHQLSDALSRARDLMAA